MFNDKQIELSHTLFDKLKSRFQDVQLVEITESAENPQDIWVRILMPEDVDQELEVWEMAGEISTDILLDYGHHITIIATNPPEASA